MLVLTVIVVAFGRIFYDVDIPGSTLPAVLVTLAVGAFAFCAMGLAVAAMVPNADAAPAVVNASILPLLFISDVFIPPDAGTPAWVEHISSIFPVRHLSEALQTGFNPFETGAGFEPLHLAVIAAWGSGGVALHAALLLVGSRASELLLASAVQGAKRWTSPVRSRRTATPSRRPCWQEELGYRRVWIYDSTALYHDVWVTLTRMRRAHGAHRAWGRECWFPTCATR